MKFSFLILSASVFVTACNTNPKPAEAATAQTPDTLVTAPVATSEVKEESTASTATEKRKTSTQRTSDNSTATSTMSSESDNSAKAKKGWSKTAKGAVIGGVVGAGTGAVVNKKNRAVGAVVGGVVGAGAGAIVGNELDKKDGRH
jgi:hypothetical protein